MENSSCRHSMPSHADLLKLRRVLEEEELSFKHRQQLNNDRNSLEEAILRLQEEMAKFAFRIHQEKNQSAHLLNKFNKKKAILQRLKQDQGRIDHLLDTIEDLTEEGLEKKRLYLLEAMWEFYPQRRESQEVLWREMKGLEERERELEAIEELLQHLCEQFEKVIQTRKSIKGRGIFNYIFGTSPNLIIERQLLAAHGLIHATLPLLHRTQEQRDKDLQPLFQEIYHVLQPLEVSCKSSWSFRHIDTIFTEAYHSLQKLSDSLHQKQKEILKKIKFLMEERDRWIQQL